MTGCNPPEVHVLTGGGGVRAKTWYNQSQNTRDKTYIFVKLT